MKLIDLWKKLGKQTFKQLNKDAVVFVGNEKYIITDIRYENGKPLGLEAEKNILGEEEC